MRNRSAFLSIAGLLLAGSMGLASIAEARTWQADDRRGSISFSGRHMGKTFTGRFDKWDADIEFDPAKPDAARVEVTIDLGSARTGDAMYDKTLRNADWFDIGSWRQAKFVSKRITKAGRNRYVADGKLTIRGRVVPVELPFTLDIERNTAKMTGRVTLKRTDWGIGSRSDPKGEWVSLDIPVEVELEARAK